MNHRKMFATVGTVAMAATVGLSAPVFAGSAPATTVTTAAAAAPARPWVDVADLVTAAQAQRGLNASAWGRPGLTVGREDPLRAAGRSGSPLHLDMFRSEAIASAAVHYRASENLGGRPVGYVVEQRSFVYATAADASRAMTRHLDYLSHLRPNAVWAEVFGFSVTRAAGVGNDAYWRNLRVPSGIESDLFFRQGNIISMFSTGQFEIDSYEPTRTSTITVARELVAAQRAAHSTSAATPAVTALGSEPIRTGDI